MRVAWLSSLLLLSCRLASADEPRELGVAAVVATDSDGEHAAASMADGLPGTRWATGRKDAEATFDLGKPATPTLCRIRWVGKKGRIYRFRLLSSPDGATWTELGGERRSTAEHGWFVDYELPPTEARFVRLRSGGNSDNGWLHIDELRLFGTGGIPAANPGPDELPETALRRVGDADGFSGFGYYGICPESPDGTRICYTRFVAKPTLPKARFAAELWVCNRDLSGQRRVADIAAAGPHNAAMALWLDNRRIAYQSGYHETFVVDAESGQTLHGPLAGQLQHNVHAGEFLICRNEHQAPGEARGLYRVDAASGEQRLILPTRALLPFADRVGRPDPDRWAIQHGQWSEDGSLIALKLYAANGIPCLLFTCRADGSDVVCFGAKPMHFQWYDGDTLFGHDSEVADGLPDNKELRRWRRDGTVVETLAGYGCHPAMSPDRQWVATETWYGSDPVRLMRYRRGGIKPDRVLATMPGRPVWTLSAHANPSFSRDGTRVYFNRAADDGLSQAYCAELP